MSLRDTLLVEFRVAFSWKAQPVWFRVLKWTIVVALGWYLWHDPRFWWWLAAAFAFSIAVHLLWRAKTRRWTEPWGGWSDVDAARRAAKKE